MTATGSFIHQLKETRASAYQEAERILKTALKFNRELSPNEQRRYDELNQQLDLSAQTIRDMEEAELRNAEADEAMARLIGDGTPNSADLPDETWLPNLRTYYAMQAEQRAVSTTAATYLTPAGYATFFDMLRRRVAVLDARPVLVSTEGNKAIKVPVVTSSVSIGAVAEGSALPESDPGLGTLTLDPKKFGALTIVNREVLEDSSAALQEMVAEALIRDMGVELDRQLIAGSGSGQNLLGIRNASGTTTGANTGTNGGSLTFTHLADTLGAAESANVNPDRMVWFMHARTWASVRKMVDNNSRPIISLDPTGDVRPTLWGKPVYIDNNLPITETKGTSTDCTSILLVDMSQVVVACSRDIELAVSEDYKFNTDQVALRVTSRFDIGVAQPTALTITSGVRA